MGSFSEGLRRAVESIKDDFFRPGTYSVGDRPVSCPHCDKGTFGKGSYPLHKLGNRFVPFDSLFKSAYTLLCMECGRLEWFVQEPIRVEGVA